MKKPYNIILILVLVVNVIMGILLFQQSAKLTKYEHVISNLEVRMEDLDDAIEIDVIPRLKEVLNDKSPSMTETKADNEIELEGTEEIDIFTKAVENKKKEPGIINIANPQYQFSIGEETYFLWITEDSGTIMNTKDTHTIYSLPSSSIEKIYKFVNEG